MRKFVPHLHLARLMTHLGEHNVITGPGDQKGPTDIGALFQNPQRRSIKPPQEDALRIELAEGWGDFPGSQKQGIKGTYCHSQVLWT